MLICGPAALETPFGARREDVVTTDQMLDAVLNELPQAHALVMAAAVADFRPAAPATEKIKKEAGIPQIKLEPSPDILKRVAVFRERQGWPLVTVGFAAETQHLLENAQSKLKAKHLDLIAANDIQAPDAGFSVDTNRITLIYPDGRIEALPLLAKAEAAERIMEQVTKLIYQRTGNALIA